MKLFILSIIMMVTWWFGAQFSSTQPISPDLGSSSRYRTWKATTTPFSAITPATNGKDVYMPFSNATSSSYSADTFCINNSSPDCITAWSSGGSSSTDTRGQTFIVAASNSISTTTADYFADGTDDQVQINAAIQAASSTGGTIKLLEGTYKISDTITLTDNNIMIVGSGNSTVLEQDTEASYLSIFTINAISNWGIENIKIKGSGTAKAYLAFNADSINTNGTIDNVYVEQLREFIELNNAASNIRIKDCTITNMASVSVEDVIKFKAADNVIISGCFINGVDNTKYAISGLGEHNVIINNIIKANVYFGGSYNSFIGNVVDNGAYYSRFYLASIDSIVSGNFFRSSTKIENTATRTSYVNNQSTEDIDIAGGVNNLIAGNSSPGLSVNTDPTYTEYIGNHNYTNGVNRPFDIRIKQMHNVSGSTLSAGDVVVYDPSASGVEMNTTTTSGDDKVFGVVMQTVTTNNYAKVQYLGKNIDLKVNGTDDIAIGDYLSTYTEAGIAKKAQAGDMVFGIALEGYTTDDSNGVIDVLLINPRKLSSTDITASNGLTVSNFNVQPATNYSIPLTASTTEWSTAYSWGDHSLVGYLTGNETITLSGDVSGSGATAITTTIGSDKVDESNLKVTNSPTDNYILSYDSATGGFTWVQDQTGSGTSPWTDNGTWLSPTNGEFIDVDHIVATSTTATSTFANSIEITGDYNLITASSTDYTNTFFQTNYIAIEGFPSYSTGGYGKGFYGLFGESTGGIGVYGLDQVGSIGGFFQSTDSSGTGLKVRNTNDTGMALWVYNGIVDFGTADAFRIVTSTAPTVDATGELALDTTDNQLLLGDSSGTARVFARAEQPLFSVTMASTSVEFASGGILPIAKNMKDGRDITQFRCYVDGGTSVVVNVSDGTNDTETITCGTSVTSDTNVATNSTFTANEKWELQLGTITGSPDYLIFEAYGYIIRE